METIGLYMEIEEIEKLPPEQRVKETLALIEKLSPEQQAAVLAEPNRHLGAAPPSP